MMAALSVTYLFSILLQNLLFCILKVAVLQCKIYAFTVQNSHYRNAKVKVSSLKDVFLYKS